MWPVFSEKGTFGLGWPIFLIADALAAHCEVLRSIQIQIMVLETFAIPSQHLFNTELCAMHILSKSSFSPFPQLEKGDSYVRSRVHCPKQINHELTMVVSDPVV